MANLVVIKTSELREISDGEDFVILSHDDMNKLIKLINDYELGDEVNNLGIKFVDLNITESATG